MLGLTVAAIALLLVTIPVLKIGVVYADDGPMATTTTTMTNEDQALVNKN
jgi:hypothetical protein